MNSEPASLAHGGELCSVPQGAPLVHRSGVVYRGGGTTFCARTWWLVSGEFHTCESRTCFCSCFLSLVSLFICLHISLFVMWTLCLPSNTKTNLAPLFQKESFWGKSGDSGHFRTFSLVTAVERGDKENAFAKQLSTYL